MSAECDIVAVLDGGCMGLISRAVVFVTAARKKQPQDQNVDTTIHLPIKHRKSWRELQGPTLYRFGVGLAIYRNRASGLPPWHCYFVGSGTTGTTELKAGVGRSQPGSILLLGVVAP